MYVPTIYIHLYLHLEKLNNKTRSWTETVLMMMIIMMHSRVERRDIHIYSLEKTEKSAFFSSLLLLLLLFMESLYHMFTIRMHYHAMMRDWWKSTNISANHTYNSWFANSIANAMALTMYNRFTVTARRQPNSPNQASSVASPFTTAAAATTTSHYCSHEVMTSVGTPVFVLYVRSVIIIIIITVWRHLF